MNLIRHGVAGLILFAVLIGLFIGFYDGIEHNYDVPKDTTTIQGVETTDSVADRIQNLNILEGVESITNAFQTQNLQSLTDILGALATGGIGLLLTLLGIFTFPFEIGSILTSFYGIPPILINGLLIAMCSYIAFILISAYTRGEV